MSKRADAPIHFRSLVHMAQVQARGSWQVRCHWLRRDGKGIDSLLVAEPSPSGLRPVGRVEFWRAGALNEDAREALAVLTRPSPCIRIRAGSGVRWTEPKLLATVRHFGRTGGVRAGVLQALSVAE